jgi:hypothetical protein
LRCRRRRRLPCCPVRTAVQPLPLSHSVSLPGTPLLSSVHVRRLLILSQFPIFTCYLQNIQLLFICVSHNSVKFHALINMFHVLPLENILNFAGSYELVSSRFACSYELISPLEIASTLAYFSQLGNIICFNLFSISKCVSSLVIYYIKYDSQTNLSMSKKLITLQMYQIII